MSLKVSRESVPNPIRVITCKDKRYIVDLDILKAAPIIGEGTSGIVKRVKCIVAEKEKEYAIKHVFFPYIDACQVEFCSHQEILNRLILNKDKLEELGIVAGTGIEKKSLGCFSKDDKTHFMMKKLYDKTWHQAVQQGDFEDVSKLCSGALQMLEGLISMITIGALYFDLKPANILVGRGGRFELAYTDFEKIDFLNFNKGDDAVIKDVFVRMPPFWAHEAELKLLGKKTRPSSDEFLIRLQQLYSFVLGAAFFEMSTKMSLRKFILVQFFSYCMKEQGASETMINHLWEVAKKITDKHLCELVHFADANYQFFFASHLEHTCYPDLELMGFRSVQEGLSSEMKGSKAPKFFIDLVVSMLQIDRHNRISLHNALALLKEGIAQHNA